MNKLDLMTKISNHIYDHIDYMYCDNCRYSSELEYDEDGYSRCDDCHHKYNGWGISLSVSESIAEQILKMMEGQDETK